MKRLPILLSVLIFSLSASAQDGDIKILALNDLHSAVQNFPQLAYIVDSIRAKYPETLLFSAGDNRTGNPVNDMYSEPNLPMVEMMNAIGFNASTMGNHECDGGIASFANTINKSAFPYIVANAHPADSLKLHIQPFRIFERAGLRIGVLGLVQINEKMIPDAHPALFEGFRFTKPMDEIKKYEWLRDQCDVLVGLTHLGLSQDTIIADNFPMFDLLVCGHSHHLEPGLMRNNVMIVQARRDVRFLNEIDIKVRDGKVVERNCRTHNIQKARGRNEKVQAMLDKFSDNPELMRILTKSLTPFENKEQLGLMMTDAYCAETGADIAVVNAGGIRYETKDAGPISVNDILRLDPFGNNIMTIEMTGNELAEFLAEIPVHDEWGPAFVSGISYTISKDKRGQYAIKIFTEDGKKFNMSKKYKVATNSYLTKISNVINQEKVINTYKISSNSIINYLEKQPAVDFSGRHLRKIDGVEYRE